MFFFIKFKITLERNIIKKKKKIIIIIIILVLLAILFTLDIRNQLTYFHDKSYDNYFSPANINIENWTTFIVGIGASVLAIFGTWYVTNQSAQKQINNEKKIRKEEKKANEESRHLDAITGLKIYYFIKNVIEDYESSDEKNVLDKSIAIPVNKADVGYIEWQREINIMNNYLRFKNSSLKVQRPLKFIPFGKNYLSNSALVENEVHLLVDINRMKAIHINRDVKNFYENASRIEVATNLQIDENTKKILSYIANLYFEDEININERDHLNLSNLIQDQYTKISEDYNRFKENIKKLEEESDINRILKLYEKIDEYIFKYNALQLIFGSKRYIMRSLENTSFEVNLYRTTDSNEFLNNETDMQLLINKLEFKEIIKEIES